MDDVVYPPTRSVGRSLPQIEAPRKVQGLEIYTPDVKRPGMLHGAILRSPHPHAEIRGIDVSKATALPGVHAVITGMDLPGIKYVHLSKWSDRYPLARDKVRFFGEEVAAVAAESPEVAQQALHLIEVDYKPLPAAFTPEEALMPGAPDINQGPNPTGIKNVAIDFNRDFGDLEANYAKAAFIIEGDYRNGNATPMCMETNGTVAEYDPNTGDLVLWTSTQAPFFVRKEVAHVLGLPTEKVHVRPVAVGGGFGGKSKVCEQEAIAAALALRTSRAVRLVLSRYEDMISGKIDYAKTMRVKHAVDKDGNILARSTSMVLDNGGYTAYGAIYVAAARQRTCSLYRVQSAHFDCRLVYTNKLPGGQYRGMGAPHIIWAIEDQIDLIADRLGRDRIDYRIQIANRSGDITPLGWEITSCELVKCLETVRDRLDWNRKRAERKPLRGLGVASMIHPSAGVLYEEGNYANISVEIQENGRLLLGTMTADAGTSQNTILAQICAEAIGIDPEQIDVRHMDTDFAPIDLGSAASRVTFVTGNAARHAGENFSSKLRQAISTLYGIPAAEIELVNGTIKLGRLNEPPMTFAEVYKHFGNLRTEGFFRTPATRPDPDTGYGNYAAAYCFGAQGCEVEIDPDTGKVKILNFVAAQDVGRPINPLSLRGQIIGGIMQGIGLALYEEMVFEEGRPVTTSYLDYKVPRFDDLPPIEFVAISSNDAIGPFGAKAAGEPAINATIAAISNAISDALGVRMRDLPITPEKIITVLRDKRGARGKIPTKPFSRTKNLHVETVRRLYPSLIFPLMKKYGPRLAGPEKPASTPDYKIAKNLNHALSLLRTEGAKVRAGGTDIHVGIKQGIYAPSLIVDISRLPELQMIEYTSSGLTIGAGVKLNRLAGDDDIADKLPILRSAINLIATNQIRNMATVGGNLCQQKRCWFFRNSLPCYKNKGATCPCFAVCGDNRHHSIISAGRCNAPCPACLAPVLAVLDAIAVIRGPEGMRRLPMAEFYTWSGEPAMTPQEILVAVEIPKAAEARHSSFMKFAISKGHFAEASVAVSLQIKDGFIETARIALGAVSPFPERPAAAEAVLTGQRPSTDLFADAALKAVQGALPLSSNDYKVDLVVALTERALGAAVRESSSNA